MFFENRKNFMSRHVSRQNFQIFKVRAQGLAAEQSTKGGSQMAKECLNVYKRKDGRYEGRYKKGRDENHKLIFGSVYASRKKDAVRKLLEKQREYANYEENTLCRGKRPEECPRPQKKGLRLKEWLAGWMELKALEVKRTSYVVYVRQVRNHILPELGELALEEIDAQTIGRFLEQLQRKGLAGSTIHGICRLLRCALSEAREQGLVESIPARRTWPRAAKRKEARHLALRERKAVVTEAGKREFYEIMAALYTGMRIGEVAGLKWKDIDLKNGTLKVARTLQRVPVRRTAGDKKEGLKTCLDVFAPKSQASIREIPIAAPLRELLKKLWEGSRKREEDYVFAAKKHPERPLDPRTFQRRFAKVCKAAHVEAAHFHTLRHTFATVCMENGFDVEALRYLMGHSTARITYEWYGHSTPEHRERLMNHKFRLTAERNFYEPSA